MNSFGPARLFLRQELLRLESRGGMEVLVTILIGVGIGVMVELLLPGHTFSELILAVVLGTAGALLARYVASLGGWVGTDEPGSYLVSAFGAIVVLVLYGLFFRRGHGARR